ncbi:MAG: anthranilate phosphoribosyltransferase, partial [Nitrosopumilus sp.]|nr:anthranilate phosphoribosyltransferase [Nitrosopumilus sp.]
KKLSEKKNLTSKEIFDVIVNILNGNCSEIFISAFLISLLLKGENIDEITGTVEALQSHSIKISPSVNLPIIDNCGTGGDFLNTFNISTASALVASSCNGVVVAKHGNRSSSSLSGSADFFEFLGYDLNTESKLVIQSIETIGFGFIFAPKFHPGLKNVSKVRKELGLRTIFNRIGPLCNPCTNLYGQVIGVSDPILLNILPKVIPILGLKNALIIHSHDGMDELSTCSKNTIIKVSYQDEEYNFNKLILEPSELGMPKCSLNEISVKNKLQSIMETMRVIYGIKSSKSKENIVLLNSAALLLTGNVVNSFKEGIPVVKESLDGGAPQKKLRDFINKYGDISKLEDAEKLL